VRPSRAIPLPSWNLGVSGKVPVFKQLEVLSIHICHENCRLCLATCQPLLGLQRNYSTILRQAEILKKGAV
jgi:hypothetical protein